MYMFVCKDVLLKMDTHTLVNKKANSVRTITDVVTYTECTFVFGIYPGARVTQVMAQ